MPRGDALRLIDQVPGFQVLVVGKSFDQGESNDPPTPPELVGTTLVVETPNHLQAVAVVDLFVRDDKFEFADGSNTAAAGRAREPDRAHQRVGSAASPRPAKRASLRTLIWPRAAPIWSV